LRKGHTVYAAATFDTFRMYFAIHKKCSSCGLRMNCCSEIIMKSMLVISIEPYHAAA
jgi:hypothetical protein